MCRGQLRTAALVVRDHRADVAADRRAAAAERRAEAKRAEQERQRAEEARLAQARSAHQACVDQLAPLVGALSDADARLDVGLSQKELSVLIGDASVAYSRIDIDQLTGACLAAGAKLENAMNTYIGTVSTWNDCIFEIGCDVDTDVLPGMQDAWLEASAMVEEATDLIATLDPDGTTYDPTGAGDAVSPGVPS